MKILISGGAGYIGGVLSYALCDKKIKYAVIDNLSTSQKKNLPKDTIFYKGCISNVAILKRVFKEFAPSHIIHLAGSLDARESEIYKEKYYINNIKNSKIFLNFFINKDIKNFIFASTAAVYKNSSNNKMEGRDIQPSNYYGKTKLEIEKFLSDNKKKNNLNLKILRFFNVVGADRKLRSGSLSKKSNQLFNSLLKSIIEKDNFFIYGNKLKTNDGTCVRDFVDVIDLVKVIIYFIKSKKKFKFDIFNVGTSKGLSVLQIVKLFIIITKKKIDYTYAKSRKGDPVHSICSNKRLVNTYNFKFSSIQSSIKRHYKFYIKNFKAYV
tara:strand:- start:267 stop:1238 length:972 start_codon:yes stop_codon:yes gene_type:complete